ncbi:MAG: DUF354 domain-containing protein, partial [bacterium]
IEELEKRGHSISITAREYAQTTGMLDELGMEYTLIGAHAGAKLSKKLFEVIKRSAKLVTYAKNRKFDLALTFNSASLAIAAKMLRIRSIVFMDYEFQPLNHLTFRLCNRVVTPVCFPDAALLRFNALGKTVKYEGLKEEVYLVEHRSCNNPLEQLNISKDKVIVIVRPPATMALYHRFKNDLFYETVHHILQNRDVAMIAFPRSVEQRKIFESFGDPKLTIPQKAVDGRDMLHYADMVLSAGGTMNREAGVLGVPAYTVFKGKIGAADKSLIALGRIVPIRSKDDFKKIVIQKAKQKISLVNPNVRKALINIILEGR